MPHQSGVNTHTHTNTQTKREREREDKLAADVYYSMAAGHATVCAATLARIVSRFQSAIEDGAFPECALGIVHSLNVTAFMSINTPAIYAGSLLLAGNPVAYAVTPYVFGPRALPMGVVQRVANCLTHVFADLLHWVS